MKTHVSARDLLLIGLLVTSQSAWAISGAFLPQAPRGVGGQDVIETGTGTRCSQSLNSPGAYLDVGVVGTQRGDIPTTSGTLNLSGGNQEGMVYARVSMPLSAPPKRIDCSRVFNLEIERLKQEIQFLKMNIE